MMAWRLSRTFSRGYVRADLRGGRQSPEGLALLFFMADVEHLAGRLRRLALDRRRAPRLHARTARQPGARAVRALQGLRPRPVLGDPDGATGGHHGRQDRLPRWRRDTAKDLRDRPVHQPDRHGRRAHGVRHRANGLQATLMVIIFMMTQMAVAGGIVPIDGMDDVAQGLSMFMPARWALSLLGDRGGP